MPTEYSFLFLNLPARGLQQSVSSFLQLFLLHPGWTRTRLYRECRRSPYKKCAYADNAEFWEEVERHTWNLAFRSETQLHYVDASVQIMTKAPVEEDLNSQVVWNAEARWFSKTKPVITPVAPIATLLKCFEITA